MWMIVVLFCVSVAVGAVALNHEVREPVVEASGVDHLAYSMGLYRDVVASHVRATPTAPGPVPDEVLAFPAWYARNPTWANEVMADGTVVVYSRLPVPPTLATRIAALSQGSLLAGVARQRPGGDTFLYSPDAGDTGIALPALPEGAAVWLARIH